MQKTARKNTKYSRNETILKIGHLPKAIAHAKAIAFSPMVSLDQKLKMPKTCQKPFYKAIRAVLCKKTARKNTKYPRNETILSCKGYSPCKGYSHRLRAVPLRSVTSKLGRTGESEFTRARKARVRSELKPRGSWGEGRKGGRDCILFCNRGVQIFLRRPSIGELDWLINNRMLSARCHCNL